MKNMSSNDILSVVLASLEAHMAKYSDFAMNEIVFECGEITHFELIDAYESLLQGTAKIIEMPVDRDDMSHFVEYVGGLVVADAESMYDSTTYPGEVSDQLEREEAMANYTVMTEVLGKLIVDLELEVDSDVLSSDCLDAAIDNEQE